jgi:hypothetical protein
LGAFLAYYIAFKNMPAVMTDTSFIPFFRSFLLGKNIDLDKLSDLPTKELEILNVETLAALNEARYNHDSVDNKQSDEAHTEFRRMKVAGYFQAAIKIALDQR